MKITTEGLRRAEYCASGVHLWALQHGMTMRQVLTEGLDLEARPELREDPFVKRLREIEGNTDGLE